MNDEPKTANQIGPAPRERPAPLQDSVSAATQRIQQIIEAAEKAAAGIIADAEAQARLYLDQSRRRADRMGDERAQAISDITDSLIERAEAVKRQSDDLILALDQAKTQIDERVRERASPMPESESEPVPAPITPPRLRPVAAPPIPPEAGPRVTAHPAVTAPTAGARLIATQMVVAGSSRVEIEDRLRNEFGIQEAGPVLDAILGPEG